MGLEGNCATVGVAIPPPRVASENETDGSIAARRASLDAAEMPEVMGFGPIFLGRCSTFIDVQTSAGKIRHVLAWRRTARRLGPLDHIEIWTSLD
jgi:hypothetical protein